MNPKISFCAAGGESLEMWRCVPEVNGATDSPWVCSPAPAKSPCDFQLATAENASNSSSWFCSLYYYFVLENEGLWGAEES